MSAKISDGALQLLLRLLEAPALIYPRATIAHFGGPADELTGCRLLLPGDVGKWTSDAEDDTIASVEMSSVGLEFWSHTQGRTAVAQNALRDYTPDMKAIFALVGGDELKLHPAGPKRLDAQGLVWDLGLARLGTKMSSVWLVRRLGDHAAEVAIKEELQARPAANLRLLVTSTPRARLARFAAPNALVAPMADFISALEPGRLDWEALRALARGQPQQVVDTAVFLSPDDTALLIHGVTIVKFRGPKQKRLARLIVDAWNTAKPIRTAQMLDEAQSAANSFDQAFGKQWPPLRVVFKPGNGVWRFDI